MKKYVIKNSDGTKQDVMQTDYDTYKKAVDALIEYIDLYNSDTNSGDDNYVSPFDFIIEEVEFTDTNELITGFYRAQRFLDICPNDDIAVYGKKVVSHRKMVLQTCVSLWMKSILNTSRS